VCESLAITDTFSNDDKIDFVSFNPSLTTNCMVCEKHGILNTSLLSNILRNESRIRSSLVASAVEQQVIVEEVLSGSSYLSLHGSSLTAPYVLFLVIADNSVI
jgi:hypothetical protein